MILTGFAMKSGSDPNGIWFILFGWVIPALGGENVVRNLHHVIAWGYALFVIVHLYLLIRQDVLGRDGTVSSIFTGYKFIETNKPELEIPYEGAPVHPDMSKA